MVLGAPLLVPTLIDAAHFGHVHIREVSVGAQHMLVLLDSGELYVWGKGHKGCVPDLSHRSEPYC